VKRSLFDWDFAVKVAKLSEFEPRRTNSL